MFTALTIHLFHVEKFVVFLGVSQRAFWPNRFLCYSEIFFRRVLPIFFFRSGTGPQRTGQMYGKLEKDVLHFLLCSVSRPWGGKVMISGLTAVNFFFKFGALFPAPPWQRCMHNPSSGTSRCSVAVLPVSPVPFICTPPVSGKAPSVPLGVSPCSPRVLFRLRGAVLVLVSACLPCAISCRVLRVMWLACLCRSADFGG